MIGAVLAKPGFKGISDNPRLLDILSSFSTLFLSPDFGGEEFASLPNVKFISKTKASGYVERFSELVSLLSAEKVDYVVTVGGDGIACYLASAMIVEGKKSKEMILVGYPAGTANIGPIVREGITRESLHHVRAIDGIEVKSGDKVLGYGFNDVIIANSFLGTLNNKTVNLDAFTMEEYGIAKAVTPDGRILSPDFKVFVNGEKFSLPLDWDKIQQICVSTLWQDNIAGRAVFGGVLASVGYKHPAAISFMDRIVVDSRPENWNYRGVSTTSHVAFNENNEVVLEGLSERAHVIIDGNPFAIIDGKVSFCIHPDAVKIAF